MAWGEWRGYQGQGSGVLQFISSVLQRGPSSEAVFGIELGRKAPVQVVNSPLMRRSEMGLNLGMLARGALSKYLGRGTKALGGATALAAPYYLQRAGGAVYSLAKQRGLASTAARYGGAALAGGLGAYGLSELGEPARRRYKRINPMNARAARRAVKRLAMVRHQLKAIERTMPKRPCARCAARPRRRRC